MVSRRRFMFLLGGAATGVWLASTGLVRLDQRFVLELSGECVHLCCDILGEEVGFHHAPRTPNEPVFDEQRIAEILRRVQEEQASRESLLADARAVLQPRRSAAPAWLFHCGFCDAHRKDVAKLVLGPGVSICDACVGDSVATVAHVLRA